MPPRTQANRPVRVSTALPDDVLLLKSMKGTERLGRPFQYDLVLLSEHHDIDYKDVIGQNVTVVLEVPDADPRYFNGYVSRFEETRFEQDLVEYRATVVPWLWFLSRTADCRIFQGMSIPDIICQVFSDHDFTDFENRLHGTYGAWEYCVQYRETAFNFVSRLMEQEGIYYFFQHENGKHTLVLCDTIGSHLNYPGYDELIFRPRTNNSSETSEHVWSWITQHEVQTGGYWLNDFDFQNPKKLLLANADIDRGHAASALPMYDYPGEFTEVSEGERYSRVRVEECQAQHETFKGESDARGVCTGMRFTLTGHPRDDLEREYLTVGADYRIESDPFETVATTETKPVFEATLLAIDSAQPFRSVRTTPKPSVNGPQTAIVVGPAGEEIYTDKYGRVKVQFHWDRYGKADENSSCWVRVAQVWAGKKWGSMYLPRIGQEVIIEFLEGDPDHPIITGRVYNGECLPPYELPANGTISTLKSLTSKEGGGFNELRFEDKKNDEQLFIHAQKNLDLRVKNDCFETIGGQDNSGKKVGDRHLVVNNDQIESVVNDRHETIGRDQIEEIGRDHHLKIKGKEAIEVTGSHSFKVTDDVIEVFQKSHSEQVTENLYVKAKNVVIEATENITINVGDSFIAIESGGIKIGTNGEIVLEAAKNITQKATQDVQIEATANASVKGTAGLKLESPAQAEVNGSAMVKIQGGLIKLN